MIAYDLDIQNSAERSKQLPQDELIRLGRQIVHKQAPATV